MTHLDCAMQDDISGYRALISAVINRAVHDACALPTKNKEMSAIAKNAFEFLMGDSVSAYLDLLDIDHKFFQKNLVNNMFKDGKTKEHEFHTAKKRAFRFNYKIWHQKKSKSLIESATYNPDK